jgi:hypothetical protein
MEVNVKNLNQHLCSKNDDKNIIGISSVLA